MVAYVEAAISSNISLLAPRRCSLRELHSMAQPAGKRGAALVLELLEEELDHCLAFTGQVASVLRDLIWRLRH